MTSSPEVTYLSDYYSFRWDEEQIEMICDRLHEEKDGLHCELTVSSTFAAQPGLLRQGRFNFSATRTRSEWVKSLGDRTSSAALPWYDLFEQLCAMSIHRWRTGEPVKDLADVPTREGVPYLLNPFVVEEAPAVLFGDGGTGKSLLALAIGLSVATGEPILGVVPKRCGAVLYLDWEWDAETHAERMRAICEGYGMNVPKGSIFYRRQTASIKESAPELRKQIAGLGVCLVIGDSLGMARGGEPENAGVTLETFSAFRSFETSCLLVDHLTKDQKNKESPFGSVFTRYQSRIMWRVDADPTDVSNPRVIGLTQTKENLGKLPARAYAVDIQADDNERLVSVKYESTSRTNLPVAARPTLASQAAAVMYREATPLAIDDLWERIEKAGTLFKKNSLAPTLSKSPLFVFTGDAWKLKETPNAE